MKCGLRKVEGEGEDGEGGREEDEQLQNNDAYDVANTINRNTNNQIKSPSKSVPAKIQSDKCEKLQS